MGGLRPVSGRKTGLFPTGPCLGVTATVPTGSGNGQNYCRDNRPTYTDPTGHKFWKKVKKFFKMAAAIIITVAVAVLTGGAGLALLPTAGAWALGGFVGGFAGTLINGGSIGQAFGMGFVGAFAAGVGSVAFSGLTNIARIAAMTAIGATAGASGAAIMGGNIGLGAAAGAAAGFIGGAVGGRLADAWNPGLARAGAALATAAAGGAASSAIAGGNAGQGALLGATGVISYAIASKGFQLAMDVARRQGGGPASDQQIARRIVLAKKDDGGYEKPNPFVEVGEAALDAANPAEFPAIGIAETGVELMRTVPKIFDYNRMMYEEWQDFDPGNNPYRSNPRSLSPAEPQNDSRLTVDRARV